MQRISFKMLPKSGLQRGTLDQNDKNIFIVNILREKVIYLFSFMLTSKIVFTAIY